MERKFFKNFINFYYLVSANNGKMNKKRLKFLRKIDLKIDEIYIVYTRIRETSKRPYVWRSVYLFIRVKYRVSRTYRGG